MSLFLAAFPLKNWLEVKRAQKINDKWNQWLSEKPSLVEYCNAHTQDTQNPLCFFCGAARQAKNLKATVEDKIDFGFYNNKPLRTNNYYGYYCSHCGTELYRNKVTLK